MVRSEGVVLQACRAWDLAFVIPATPGCLIIHRSIGNICLACVQSVADSFSSPLSLWERIRSAPMPPPVTQQVLTRVRRGDPLAAITLDHSQLTHIQIKPLQHLQSQELELHLVERDLATSLLRPYHAC